MPEHNPFLSKNFVTVWLKHFNKGKSSKLFNFIEGLSFVKNPFLPLYVNVGKTHTKGISYLLTNQGAQDYQKNVFLIYDVPTYFNIDTPKTDAYLKLSKLPQYPGFLINLEEFTDLNSFMLSTFSKGSRQKLRKYNKRLEISFNIQYKMLKGPIPKEEYDFVFDCFQKLLVKRFSGKKTVNNNLESREWNFYHEVAYPLILENKASLFVVYDGNKPISVTLNYFSEDTLFEAITVFDTDYSKFHLGSVKIMKLVEWCLHNNYKNLDFSKGYFDYKVHWSNLQYKFEHHLFYDNRSLVPKTLAGCICVYFKLKQKLRDLNVNDKVHRLRFWTKNITVKKSQDIQYEFSELDTEFDSSSCTFIDINDTANNHLIPAFFDFLYLNEESIKNVKICINPEVKNGFLFIGEKKNVAVTFLT